MEPTLNLNAPLNERISMVEVDVLMRRDYSALVCGNWSEESFIDTNEFGYYLCANTWVLRTSDLGGELLGNLLRASIKEVGLVSAIRIAKKTADELTAAANIAPALDFDDCVDVQLPLGTVSARIKEWLIRTSRLPFRVARSLLVYPKRYCPYVPKHSSALHAQAVEAFEENNRANVAAERRIRSVFWYCDSCELPGPLRLPFRLDDASFTQRDWEVLDTARQIVRLIAGKFEGLSSQPFPCVGPGACRNAGPSKLERYGNMVLYGEYELSHTPRRDAGGSVFVPHPDLRERHYVRRNKAGKRIGLTRPPRITRGYWGRGAVPQICRLSTVPKTVDANRMIAVEDVCNQSHSLYVKDCLVSAIDSAGLSTLMPIRNQSENQRMAFEAADTDQLATLDMSHASDSNSKTLVQSLFDPSWSETGFERCVPFGYILDESDERPRPLHMFATMGCGCTFPVMTITIFSISAATIAVDQHYWPESVSDILAIADKVRVMGDDLICPSYYAPDIIKSLEFCGFAVNRDKSFINGRFRESCGSDWCRFDDGTEEITAHYFPRLPIGGDGRKVLHAVANEWNSTLSEREKKSGLQRVLALQHASFTSDLPQTNQFLTSLLQEYCPELSTSLPSESDSTIWTTNPSREYGYYVPDITLSVNGCDSRIANVSDYYVGLADATAFFRDEANRMGLETQAADAYVADCLVKARRVKLTVPRLAVSKAYTGCNTGVAEILGLELALQSLSATAEEILPIAISGPSEESVQCMKRQALRHVRPARLSRSRLRAEEYSVQFSVDYIAE